MRLWQKQSLDKPFPVANLLEPLAKQIHRLDPKKATEEFVLDSVWKTEAKLYDFFCREKIPLYDRKQVCVWLTWHRKKFGEACWHWSPLREMDEMACYSWNTDQRTNGEYTFKDGYYLASFCHVCDSPIFDYVSKMVKKIESEFGENVKFFASNQTTFQTCSFIMVRPAMRGGSTKYENSFIFKSFNPASPF